MRYGFLEWSLAHNKSQNENILTWTNEVVSWDKLIQLEITAQDLSSEELNKVFGGAKP